jgi:hypothetical protein
MSLESQTTPSKPAAFLLLRLEFLLFDLLTFLKVHFGRILATLLASNLRHYR